MWCTMWWTTTNRYWRRLCVNRYASQGTADLYYAVKITDVEIVDADSDEMEKLKAAIDRFDGNDVLSEHSPKVVGIFLEGEIR